MAIPVGTKVISRTNEDEPLIVGVVREDARKTINCRSFVPVIVREDGTEVMSLGITVPYSPQLLRQLERMSPKQQWEYLNYYRNMHHPEARK
jgi:hypothetical protein